MRSISTSRSWPRFAADVPTALRVPGSSADESCSPSLDRRTSVRLMFNTWLRRRPVPPDLHIRGVARTLRGPTIRRRRFRAQCAATITRSTRPSTRATGPRPPGRAAWTVASAAGSELSQRPDAQNMHKCGALRSAEQRICTSARFLRTGKPAFVRIGSSRARCGPPEPGPCGDRGPVQ